MRDTLLIFPISDSLLNIDLVVFNTLIFSLKYIHNAVEMCCIFTLILKCMLYRAKGTYFDTNRTNPFGEVLADVRRLYTKYGVWDSIKSNPLVSPVWKKYTETTPSPPNELREEISVQQDLSTDKTTSTFLIRRVAWASIRLIETINDDRLTLKPVREKKGDEYPGFEKLLEAGETFFLRNLDPLGYCVSMLVTYVYQLLFVGVSGNGVSEPESVQSLKAQLKASPSRTKSILGAVEKRVISASVSRTCELLTELERNVSPLYGSVSRAVIAVYAHCLYAQKSSGGNKSSGGTRQNLGGQHMQGYRSDIRSSSRELFQ